MTAETESLDPISSHADICIKAAQRDAKKNISRRRKTLGARVQWKAQNISTHFIADPICGKHFPGGYYENGFGGLPHRLTAAALRVIKIRLLPLTARHNDCRLKF